MDVDGIKEFSYVTRGYIRYIEGELTRRPRSLHRPQPLTRPNSGDNEKMGASFCVDASFKGQNSLHRVQKHLKITNMNYIIY